MNLVIAEKPSVAQSIAKVIGATIKHDGYLEGPAGPGDLRLGPTGAERRPGYLVSWCVGHLVELAEPEEYDGKYEKWRKEDLPILPTDWLYQVSPGTKKQFQILKELMKREDVDCVTNACDAGREGELIFRLVYEKAGCKKPIKRLWISSMEDEAIHNHIIYNSTTLDCHHKFRNFLFCGIALQRVSDLVCLEHGCSVIKPRKPGEREKRTVYPNRKSIRDKVREDIDLAMSSNPKNMEELLKYLEEMGYEIKRAKHIGIKGEGQKSFLRFDSLGAGYREEDFEKVFKGEESFNPPPREKQSHRYEKPEKKFDMLLDIQDIISKGKGSGYERWAKVHNIKQISQTLIYLRDHDIRDMDELTKRASDSAIRFAEFSQTIKDAEK